MWQVLLKKKGKENIFFKTAQIFSLFIQKISEASSSLPRCFFSSSSPLKLQNSSSFLPQIARRSHFRSIGTHLYFVGLQISGMGGLLLTWNSWVLGFWELWWVVLLGYCLRVVICERICWNHAKLDMFDVNKITHADLGFYDDALWYMYAENVDGKLVEMMGRVNLGLNVRMVVLWVEKCEILRVRKAKFGVSGNWSLKWVDSSLKCQLGLVGKLGQSKWEKWVTNVKEESHF